MYVAYGAAGPRSLLNLIRLKVARKGTFGPQPAIRGIRSAVTPLSDHRSVVCIRISLADAAITIS